MQMRWKFQNEFRGLKIGTHTKSRSGNNISYLILRKKLFLAGYIANTAMYICKWGKNFKLGLGVWKLVHILKRGRGTILATLFLEKIFLAGYIANIAMYICKWGKNFKMSFGAWKLVHILNQGRGTILATLFWEKNYFWRVT